MRIDQFILPESICQNAYRRIHLNPYLIGPNASSKNPIVDEMTTKQIKVIINRSINIERVSTQPMSSKIKSSLFFSILIDEKSTSIIIWFELIDIIHWC